MRYVIDSDLSRSEIKKLLKGAGDEDAGTPRRSRD